MLLGAASRGDLELVRALLTRAELTSKLQERVLVVAAGHGHPHVLEALIREGIDVPVVNEFLPTKVGYKPADTACGAVQIEALEAVLELKQPLFAEDRARQALLSGAMRTESIELVRMILERGIRPVDQRILSQAVIQKDEDMIEILLEHGIHHLEHHLHCRSGLDHALDQGNFHLASRLIDSEAFLTNERWQAISLFRALITNQTGIVLRMLEKGVRYVCDNDGKTPLCIAVQQRNVEMADKLIQFLIEQYMKKEIEHKTPEIPSTLELHTPDKEGRTPLSYAAELGDIPMIQLLMQYGATVIRRKGEHKRSPLHFAVRTSSKAVRAILQIQSVHPVGESGRLPLHDAVLYGSIETIRILLEYDSPHKRDDKQQTPTQLAITKGYKHVIKLLTEHFPDDTDYTQ